MSRFINVVIPLVVSVIFIQIYTSYAAANDWPLDIAHAWPLVVAVLLPLIALLPIGRTRR